MSKALKTGSFLLVRNISMAMRKKPRGMITSTTQTGIPGRISLGYSDSVFTSMKLA